ncbi:MAG: hypothetical protein ACREOD_05275 [Candidatus Dormibacteria bacterium]
MTGKDEKRLAAEIAGWLEGEGPAPTADPTARAVARTAVLLVDALAPTPLHPLTRARLYDRAMAQVRPATVPVNLTEALDDPWGELRQLARQVPAAAWLGAALLTGVALAAVLLRQRVGAAARAYDPAA